MWPSHHLSSPTIKPEHLKPSGLLGPCTGPGLKLSGSVGSTLNANILNYSYQGDPGKETWCICMDGAGSELGVFLKSSGPVQLGFLKSWRQDRNVLLSSKTQFCIIWIQICVLGGPGVLSGPTVLGHWTTSILRRLLQFKLRD